MPDLRSLLLCIGVGLAAASVSAQEVTFELAEGSDGLRRALRANSLTLDLRRNEELNSPQDYVAAARADYRRLLTGLYAQGYYSGTISIRIDGREAADIQPLDAPARIDA
ncbi:MAG: outer membrane protein assembly factor, partial [Rubellimicrobium sp.]|nr:outer membrane protein assembly factor [Rubellimicrobium sp.]